MEEGCQSERNEGLCKTFIALIIQSGIEELHQQRGQDLHVNVMTLAFQRKMPGVGNSLCNGFSRVVHKWETGAAIHGERRSSHPGSPGDGD